jgi:hypothetical protein
MNRIPRRHWGSRVKHRILRGFIASDGEPLTTGQLLQWVFPRQGPPWDPVYYRRTREAAQYFAGPNSSRSWAWSPLALALARAGGMMADVTSQNCQYNQWVAVQVDLLARNNCTAEDVGQCYGVTGQNCQYDQGVSLSNRGAAERRREP